MRPCVGNDPLPQRASGASTASRHMEGSTAETLGGHGKSTAQIDRPSMEEILHQSVVLSHDLQFFNMKRTTQHTARFQTPRVSQRSRLQRSSSSMASCQRPACALTNLVSYLGATASNFEGSKMLIHSRLFHVAFHIQAEVSQQTFRRQIRKLNIESL